MTDTRAMDLLLLVCRVARFGLESGVGGASTSTLLAGSGTFVHSSEIKISAGIGSIISLQMLLNYATPLL